MSNKEETPPSRFNFMEALETATETLLFKSRWLLAPLYVGLVLSLVILLLKFGQKFFSLILITFSASGQELILNILGLVDIVLIGNLLLMIIFSGYENFVSKIDMIKGHVDRPEWMGKVDYAGLKIKVISSIVAISAIELLKVFISITENTTQLTESDVMWLIIIHLTFVTSGLVFALTERILHPAHAQESKSEEHSPEEQKPDSTEGKDAGTEKENQENDEKEQTAIYLENKNL